MTSLADERGPQDKGRARSFAVRGWHNPYPLRALIEPDQIDVLRSRIAINIDELLPRCEKLNAALPESVRKRTSYKRSRGRERFDLVVEPMQPLPSVTASPIDPPPSIRHAAVAPGVMNLDELLVHAAGVVCIGSPLDMPLRCVLASHSLRLTMVEPGEGQTIATVSGQSRPAQNSFAAWMALHDEPERAAVSAFVLTRMAGSRDVALLRHRLHPYQRILVEAGSPALTWLLSVWGGVVSRVENIFLFSEPDRWFRDPSNRFRLSDEEPWPRVSVVTVSYNQREFLEECVRSVLDQRYPNLEYIIVDAGSTDGSAELLREYQARHSCFSHLIIEPDQGQSHGLNKGFRLATGDILTWVNSDDMLGPLSLKRAAMALRETGADVVTGTCTRISGVESTLCYKHFAALPTLEPKYFELEAPMNWCDSWERGDWFFQPEVIFTRQIWERAGGYLKPHLFWAMDWDLWLRFALAGTRIVRIPDVIGVSRQHEAQKTTSEELYLWQIVGILREFDELLAKLSSHARGHL